MILEFQLSAKFYFFFSTNKHLSLFQKGGAIPHRKGCDKIVCRLEKKNKQPNHMQEKTSDTR